MVAALLQIFLFNNLSLSVYLNPLVYVVFIALLPMETTPIRDASGVGLAMGRRRWTATMGAAGVNTIATVLRRLRAFQRFCGRSSAASDDRPRRRRALRHGRLGRRVLH